MADNQNDDHADELVSFHPGHRSRQDGTGEHRLPPALAVIVAAVLYASLPGTLLLGPRLLIPTLEVILLVSLVATNPWRLTRETRVSRLASIILAVLIAGGNFVSLGLLVHQLIATSVKSGGGLLVAALQVWITNVIAFGLIFWELDRGGPVSRSQLPRYDIPLADIRFSHDDDRDTVIEVSRGSSKTADWMPTFVDYFYLSVTNSSAFGPTPCRCQAE